MKLFKPIFKHWSYLADFVIIVAGIIVALSLDAWWQKKQDRKTEIVLLNELRQNCKQNLKDLEANLSVYNTKLAGCNYILDHLDNSLNDGDSVGYYFSQMKIIPAVQYIKSAYNSIQSIGWQIIKNDSIRLWAMQIYDYLYPALEHLVEERDVPLAINYLDQMYYKLFDSKTKEPYEWEAIYANKEFVNLIRNLRPKWIWRIDFINTRISSIQVLQNMIESELGIGPTDGISTVN